MSTEEPGNLLIFFFGPGPQTPLYENRRDPRPLRGVGPGPIGKGSGDSWGRKEGRVRGTRYHRVRKNPVPSGGR